MNKTGDKATCHGQGRRQDERGDAQDGADKTAVSDEAADKSASTAQKAGNKTEKVLEKAGIKVEDDGKLDHGHDWDDGYHRQDDHGQEEGRRD